MSGGLSVVLAGGGTAGHVEPALALADALRRTDPDVTITALGTVRGLETTLVPARGYPLELIPPVPLPRRASPQLLALPARLVAAVAAADRVLRATAADVVVGFGGYVALPAYLAARRRGIPIVVHEGNARPGLANRVGARLTRFVAVAEATRGLPHAQVVGVPLSTAISGLDRAGAREKARAHYGLDVERPTLLVTGGSQGAARLNRTVAEALPGLLAAGVQVLHAYGRRNAAPLPAGSAPAGGPPYVALPYFDRMDLAYAAADLALCRAGMMTVAELAAVGLPAVFVPLPHGNGEQRCNALPVVQAGGALLIADGQLTAGVVLDTLVPILLDPQRLADMVAAGALAGRRDADLALAELVRTAAARRRAGPAQPC